MYRSLFQQKHKRRNQGQEIRFLQFSKGNIVWTCMLCFVLLCFGLSVGITVGSAAAADLNTAEDTADTEETEALADADAIGSIPLLERLNEPFAVSLRDHLSKLSPVNAANYVAEEITKTVDEFSRAVNVLKPTAQDYEKNFPALVDTQLKLRTLLETAHYLSSRLPETQQADWKFKFQSQASMKLNQLGATLRNQNMQRASREISNALANFFEPYQDIEETLAAEVASNAPAKGRGPSDPSEYHDSTFEVYEPSYGPSSSGGSGLQNACKNFFSSYQPQSVDAKKMDSVLTSLTRSARQQLLGYPRAGSSGYGGYEEGYDPYASSYASPNRRSSTTGRGSGLQLEEEEDTGGTVSRSSTISVTTRKSVAYGLKQMLRIVPDAQFGSKIAAAYCALAEEDFVPEIARFFEKWGGKLTDKDLEFLTSLSIEKDYAQDPRVQYIMSKAVFAMKPENSKDPKILDVFTPATGVGRFMVQGLNVGSSGGDQTRTERNMTLHILFSAGDADSALEVVRFLEDPQTSTGYKKAAIDILGQCGDERVAIPIIRTLRDPELQSHAQAALIRIGSPVEERVLTAFNARNPEIDHLVLDIVKQIGSWKSVSKLSAQQILYMEAKSSEQQDSTQESGKKQLILEPDEQSELIRKTLETGTTIVARMLGTKAPNLAQKSASRSGYPSGEALGMPDYDSSFEAGRGPDSLYGQRNKKDDGTSPRTLVGAMETPPGNAPVAWANALSYSAGANFDKMMRIIAKCQNFDTAKKAGAEMRAYSWVENYYNLAAGQINRDCLPTMETAAAKSIEASLTSISNKYKRYSQAKTRLGRSASMRDGFKQGYSTSANQSPVRGSIY